MAAVTEKALDSAQTQVESASTQPGPEAAAELALAQDVVPAEEEQSPHDKVRCSKCKLESEVKDMIERKSNRLELRFVCKSCNALQVQFARRGLQLQTLLSEDRLVNFFAEAAWERKQCEEGRLSFARARGTLKKLMVEEARHTTAEGHNGEYQPLSFWELKGYDCDRIRLKAPKETHEILGDTYRVDIHTMSEEWLNSTVERRLMELESDALQKKQKAEESRPVPLVDLEEDLSRPAKGTDNGKRKATLTEEEKDNLKKQRKAQKELDNKKKVAAAAAAKLLPTLKAVQDKLQQKVDKLQADLGELPCATKEQLEDAQTELKEVVTAATELLDLSAKGKLSECNQLLWSKDKELQQVVSRGNAALRALNDWVRSRKENIAPKAKAKAAGKSKAKRAGA